MLWVHKAFYFVSVLKAAIKEKQDKTKKYIHVKMLSCASNIVKLREAKQQGKIARL